jgi:hypothetical protein
MQYLTLGLLTLLASCGSLQKWALRRATPVFEESGRLTTHEQNWTYFRESAPANIKFMELLYLQDPANRRLQSLLIKAHAGYAYAVPETLWIEEELRGSGAHWKEQAISHYTKALDHGTSYLVDRGIKRSELLSLDEEALRQRLDKKLGKGDHEAVLFTAQAWGSLINLQKDDVALIGQVPRVKLLFDWVCGKDPGIENGMCDIFYAQYEAARPRMLGGNPELARELYAKARSSRPQHLLVRLSYLQYLVVPAMDLEAYETEARELRREFAAWSRLERENLEDSSAQRAPPELNLYNAIARRRFEIFEGLKQKIF